MAGIAGIIKKDNSRLEDSELRGMKIMLKNIAFSDKQFKSLYKKNNIVFGNVVPLGYQNKDHFKNNKLLNIVCAIDGLVFVSNKQKKLV